jgi:hypothetical protein
MKKRHSLTRQIITMNAKITMTTKEDNGLAPSRSS